MQGLKKAIESMGSARALGESIGLTGAALTMWKRRGRIPANRVLDVERVSGVSRHELRPDIYPVSESQPAIAQ